MQAAQSILRNLFTKMLIHVWPAVTQRAITIWHWPVISLRNVCLLAQEWYFFSRTVFACDGGYTCDSLDSWSQMRGGGVGTAGDTQVVLSVCVGRVPSCVSCDRFFPWDQILNNHMSHKSYV